MKEKTNEDNQNQPAGDFYVKITVKNGRVLKAMDSMGISSVAELSRLCGATQHCIGQVINFKQSARREDGTYRNAVVKMCAAMSYSPSELFPEHLDYEICTDNTSFYINNLQLSDSELCVAPLVIEQNEYITSSISDAMNSLPADEREALRLRIFDNCTLADAARRLGTTAQTVSNREGRALKKLRHPSISNKLIECMDICRDQKTLEK